jgi:hypothetical protein
MNDNKSRVLQQALAVAMVVSSAAGAGSALAGAADPVSVHDVSVAGGPEKDRESRKRGLETKYVFSGGITLSPEVQTHVFCSNAGRKRAKVVVEFRGAILPLPPVGSGTGSAPEAGGATKVFTGTANVKPFRTTVFATDVSDFHFVDVDLGADGPTIPLFGEIRSNRDDIVCAAQVLQNDPTPAFAYDLQLDRVGE